MPFPQTRDEMIARGYKFENHSKCRSCGAEIEWFTTPRGKKMPFALMHEGSSPAVVHFADCPDADLFRR